MKKSPQYLLANILRRVARFLDRGIDPDSGWRWSHSVHQYYAVSAQPRWGHGQPSIHTIAENFASRRAKFAGALAHFSRCQSIFAQIGRNSAADVLMPCWQNGWYSDFDAASLVTMLVANAPTQYVEIGSGHSTKFARFTIDATGLPTKITSIDPHPRTLIDALCDAHVRTRLEDCELALFDQLIAGDIVFFDGSHRVFTNSDTTVFFLDVLPRLKSGVIVHIHDIFLPDDYPPEWERRMYSEQYMLAVMLLAPKPGVETLLPNYFISSDPAWHLDFKELIRSIGCGESQPSGFWMRIS